MRTALAGCAVIGVAASTWALAMQPASRRGPGRSGRSVTTTSWRLVLVAILPPAVLGAWRVAGPDRRRLRQGATLFVAAVLVWTLAATGSMSGLAALVVQALAARGVIPLAEAGGAACSFRLPPCWPLGAGLALATAWAGSRLDVPGPLGRLGAGAAARGPVSPGAPYLR